jgi:hypothetical protein
MGIDHVAEHKLMLNDACQFKAVPLIPRLRRWLHRSKKIRLFSKRTPDEIGRFCKMRKPWVRHTQGNAACMRTVNVPAPCNWAASRGRSCCSVIDGGIGDTRVTDLHHTEFVFVDGIAIFHPDGTRPLQLLVHSIRDAIARACTQASTSC